MNAIFRGGQTKPVMRTQGSNPKVAPIGLGDEATLLKMLDLFSGIGGFSLAAEWTGAIETVAFCE